MSAMAGLRDVMLLIPPAMAGNVALTTPATTLTIARVLGSIDPTYGTVGFLPPTDGTPWASISMSGVKEQEIEFGRITPKATVTVFIAIEHTDTPSVSEDYHDLQVAWADAMRQFVAANRRLAPGSISNFPTAGDVRWRMTDVKMQEAKPVLGHAWRGIDCITELQATIIVNYQG